MSLDNVVAIAAAAQGAHADHQVILVIFGLLVSVPIIIWGSTLLLKLLDRFPIIVTLGAGLLGWIAAGMLVTDVAVIKQFGAIEGPAKIAIETGGARSEEHTSEIQSLMRISYAVYCLQKKPT